jgi:hypothetical protein
MKSLSLPLRVYAVYASSKRAARPLASTGDRTPVSKSKCPFACVHTNDSELCVIHAVLELEDIFHRSPNRPIRAYQFQDPSNCTTSEGQRVLISIFARVYPTIREVRKKVFVGDRPPTNTSSFLDYLAHPAWRSTTLSRQ